MGSGCYWCGDRVMECDENVMIGWWSEWVEDYGCRGDLCSALKAFLLGMGRRQVMGDDGMGYYTVLGVGYWDWGLRIEDCGWGWGWLGLYEELNGCWMLCLIELIYIHLTSCHSASWDSTAKELLCRRDVAVGRRRAVLWCCVFFLLADCRWFVIVGIYSMAFYTTIPAPLHCRWRLGL